MHLSTLEITSSFLNRETQPYLAHWAALACGKLQDSLEKRHGNKKGVTRNSNLRMDFFKRINSFTGLGKA
jgi:hypothetical protein